jgi:hypothetical protein
MSKNKKDKAPKTKSQIQSQNQKKRSYSRSNSVLSDTSVDLEIQNLSEDEDEPYDTTSRTPTPLRKLIFIIVMIPTNKSNSIILYEIRRSTNGYSIDSGASTSNSSNERRDISRESTPNSANGINSCLYFTRFHYNFNIP